MDFRARVRAYGFTLVELLVVISIIGLVLSLMLPAVMSAREASRATHCKNNLRQIGVGLANFESARGRYPGSFAGVSGSPISPTKPASSYSPSSWIAADLGGQALANKVETEQTAPPFDPNWTKLDLPAPAVLHCPSDSFATGRASSYRYCRGNLPRWPKDPGGVFRHQIGVRAAEITDGLANTAFASERLVSNPTKGWPDRRRDMLVFPGGGATPSIGLACNQANEANQVGPWSSVPSGTSWMSGEWYHNAYYHLYPPNSAWVDCRKEHSLPMAVTSARSNHPGGVHLLLGDTHVRFVKDTVQLAIWRNLATRHGGEPTEGE